MGTIFKSTTDKMVCGVCGGIAEYFNIDSTLVRLVMVALILCADIGLLLYILAAFVLKEEKKEEVNANYYNA